VAHLAPGDLQPDRAKVREAWENQIEAVNRLENADAAEGERVKQLTHRTKDFATLHRWQKTAERRRRFYDEMREEMRTKMRAGDASSLCHSLRQTPYSAIDDLRCRE
jgi:ATPase subunit of ABC transporter with duplicated ATPase domains